MTFYSLVISLAWTLSFRTFYLSLALSRFPFPSLFCSTAAAGKQTPFGARDEAVVVHLAQEGVDKHDSRLSNDYRNDCDD
jgi:hypothetical protein